LVVDDKFPKVIRPRLQAQEAKSLRRTPMERRTASPWSEFRRREIPRAAATTMTRDPAMATPLDVRHSYLDHETGPVGVSNDRCRAQTRGPSGRASPPTLNWLVPQMWARSRRVQRHAQGNQNASGYRGARSHWRMLALIRQGEGALATTLPLLLQ
jgi:hypothetical protein